MELSVGPDRTVLAEFEVTADHQGAPGLIHGGVLAAAFDEVLGALSWLLQTPAVTARLETDFRRPVPVGSRVLMMADVESQDGRKTWRRAVARSTDGVELASARALFLQVPADHFRRHGGGLQSWEAAAKRSET
ncbi:MAG: PaaI family thioesterase [Actinomycetia bacterium]|nr:PaaI family thioesterase [Actinomycetes bacterium]